MSYDKATRAVLKAAAKHSVKTSAQALSKAKRFQSTIATMNAQVQRGDPVSFKEAKKLATQVETWYRNLMRDTPSDLFNTEPIVKQFIAHLGEVYVGTSEMAWETERFEKNKGNASNRQKYYLGKMLTAINDFIQTFTRAQREHNL